MGTDTIRSHRERIADIDDQLLRLVADRVESAREVGRAKREAGAATLDPAREAAVVREAVARARALALPAEPVRELFWVLIRLCRDAQLQEPQ
jgi:chorismate mutase